MFYYVQHCTTIFRSGILLSNYNIDTFNLQVCNDENNNRTSTRDNKRTYRILVVIDEADITLTFSVALKENGFEVETFNDSEKALSNFKPNYYDLLLLDIRMPTMVGFKLYKKLKEIDGTVKVCFVTSYEIYYDSLKKDYPSLDVGYFIHKPILMDHLVKQVCIELGISKES